MGLAERRAIESFKNDDYPDWKRKIDDAATFDLPVEVHWSELAVGEFADRYPEFFAGVYFQPLVDALRGITFDELGKAAARDGLTRIVIRNSGQYASLNGSTFADGVLTFDHQPHVNVSDVAERADGLRKLLEAGL